MENQSGKTESESGPIFEISDAPAGFEWPVDASGRCTGMRIGKRTVLILRSPDCPESEVADMKAIYEGEARG